MHTIKEMATLLGVSEQSAYGLMQFLAEIGHVTITEAPSNGKRGRRPKMYQLSERADNQLINLMHKLCPAPVRQPASFTPETDYIGFLG